ncbi:MAG TPA: hypothetical protein VE664_02660 [Actinomycetes bacterium]|jgi:hypothetical protein|nr:hypothetical protein [Actinomycetes bacterium]
MHEITGFRLVHVPGDDLPELTGQQQRALIGIASVGGTVARLALSRAMLTDLLHADVIAASAPATIEITSIGIRWLAHMAAQPTPSPL